MTIRQITSALEEFAPLSLQDGYDNAGLQIGLAEDADATGALLCLDVTEDVVDEAVKRGCNLIVSHHPLLFRPLKSIAGRDYIERAVIKAIKNDVAIYSSHTNLDSAYGGVNYKIAEKLGLVNLQWLKPKGEYVSEGGEVRTAGEGVIGELPEALSAEAFQQKVKSVFGLESLRVNNAAVSSVRRVALCGGAGAFLAGEAVKKGADAFLTGEIGYHRFFGYEGDIMLLELGHFESEQYTLEVLADVIRRKDSELPVFMTEQKTNPIVYL